MKLLTKISFALILFTTACSEDDSVLETASSNDDFLIENSSSGVEIAVTQSEALDLLSNGPARLVSVSKPQTAIRRWWKAFSISFDPSGKYMYETIEDDVIPASGSWVFAQNTGVDIVLFNTNAEDEYFERFADVTFKKTEIGTIRFEMKIDMIESDKYSSALVGEWKYIFEL